MFPRDREDSALVTQRSGCINTAIRIGQRQTADKIEFSVSQGIFFKHLNFGGTAARPQQQDTPLQHIMINKFRKDEAQEGCPHECCSENQGEGATAEMQRRHGIENQQHDNHAERVTGEKTRVVPPLPFFFQLPVIQAEGGHDGENHPGKNEGARKNRAYGFDVTMCTADKTQSNTRVHGGKEDNNLCDRQQDQRSGYVVSE